MAELAILAGLEADFKGVVHVVLVAEDLFVHVDASVVEIRTRENRTHLGRIQHLASTSCKGISRR